MYNERDEINLLECKRGQGGSKKRVFRVVEKRIAGYPVFAGDQGPSG
jgi:hypothetical protein